MRAADLYVVGEPVYPTVLPAVSGINGNISIEGGALDKDGFGALSGSVSLPIGQRFGLQLDGSVGLLDDEFYGSAGGHLFWRDPAYAFLGIYGSYTALTAKSRGSVLRASITGTSSLSKQSLVSSS